MVCEDCGVQDGARAVGSMRRCLAGGLATLLAARAWAQSVLVNNGPLATGPLLSTGTPAPAGYQWSELQSGNVSLGFSDGRLADDFTLPAGATVEAVVVYGYVTGTPTGGECPFSRGTLRLWRGRPGDPGSEIIAGDLATNRLAGCSEAMILRTPTALPETTRPVWVLRLNLGEPLGPGTYWLDWGLGTGACPLVTIVGQLTRPGANARRFNGTQWLDVRDAGTQLPQEFPFLVLGRLASGCYANCDGSTAVPVLNVADFTCFLQRFAGGEAYANCDGSTAVPVLNVADFTCYLQRFAAGCSAP